MEKYLFTDGTNVIRELQSKEELDKLIDLSPDRDAIRIWVFSTSEWINYATYSKNSPVSTSTRTKSRTIEVVETLPEPKLPRPSPLRWIRKPLIAIAIVGIALLIYNFTRITWTKLPILTVFAERPENSPPVDADSLIQSIEYLRGVKLDKITRTNLRIRNSWPERVVVQLNSDRDSSSTGIKYHHINLGVDNSTGYLIDQVVAELTVWNDGDAMIRDTVEFRNINYTAPARRDLVQEYKGDSLSLTIQTIKARSFNFCYSADKQSNYGNFNDRWFCK